MIKSGGRCALASLLSGVSRVDGTPFFGFSSDGSTFNGASPQVEQSDLGNRCSVLQNLRRACNWEESFKTPLNPKAETLNPKPQTLNPKSSLPSPLPWASVRSLDLCERSSVQPWLFWVLVAFRKPYHLR